MNKYFLYSVDAKNGFFNQFYLEEAIKEQRPR
jgi:hypothetical protein